MHDISHVEDEYSEIKRLDNISREAIYNVGLNPVFIKRIQNKTIDKEDFGMMYDYLSTNAAILNDDASGKKMELALFFSAFSLIFTYVVNIEEKTVFHALYLLIIIFVFTYYSYTSLQIISDYKERARWFKRSQDWIAKEYGLIIPWD